MDRNKWFLGYREMPRNKQKKINRLKNSVFPSHPECQMDEVASYSSSGPKITQFIVKMLEQKIGNLGDLTFTDATACVGGQTVVFAEHFRIVNAFEIDPFRAEMLKHNVRVTGAENVNCYHADLTQSYQKYPSQDIIYLDPPWGGSNYKKETDIELWLSNERLAHVAERLAPKTRYILIKYPYNYNIEKMPPASSQLKKIWNGYYPLMPKERYALFEVDETDSVPKKHRVLL